jgi:hypothetical protein
MATYKPKQWPLVGKLLRRSSQALGCFEDLNEVEDVQDEVAYLFLPCTVFQIRASLI